MSAPAPPPGAAAWLCPICDRPYAPGAVRCPSCGADLFDEDVRALGQAAHAPGAAPPLEAGSLAIGKFLGVTRDGLAGGRSTRRLAALGALPLLVAFFVPAAQIAHPYRVYLPESSEWVTRIRWEHKMSWELF